MMELKEKTAAIFALIIGALNDEVGSLVPNILH